MSEKFNINHYNNVKVEKLGDTRPEKQINSLNENNVNKEQFKPIPVEEVSESEDNSEFNRNFSSGGETSDIETDTESYTENDDEDVYSTSSGSSTETEAPFNENENIELEGGKRTSSDTESVSSVSTTEILSKDPLFLVLSEFLMDDETGSNIVHVGNDIVKVLSKINAKLGRIADCLEKKKKQHKDKSKNRLFKIMLSLIVDILVYFSSTLFLLFLL